ncbi:MAG: endonuclease I family protein, partial [Planctomycetota bacterium]
MSNLLRAEAGPALNSPALTSLALTFLGLVGLSLPAAAQAPAGYYGSVDTSSAAALRSTLHAVIDDHQRFPYTSSSTDTWDILEDAEQQAGSSGNVLTFYSNASYTKQGGGNSFYNREHLWPTSFGFPNDNSSNYPFSDCHLLRLTDDGYNSARGNKPFRNCDPGCGEYTTSSNNGAGGGSGVYPGQSNWVSGFGATGTWEVWSDRKGDAARAILYADVRYEGGNHGSTGVSEPDLVATNDQGLISGSNTGSNESVAYMGLLDVLLAWHAADPVDQKERDRNDVVFSYQGNRNPFVDHPEWVDLLYTDTPITSQPWMNELHYDNDGADVGEFVEIAGPAGLDLAGYRVVAYNGSNGTEYDAITLSGQIPDQGNCLGALSFAFPNLQNGAPDGLCLVDPLDDVIEFLSYEGVVVATDGPAFGTSSVDMGVSESSLTPAGQSLQRIGSGTQALDFTWTGPVTESPGSVNNGQTFEDACGGTTPPPPPTGLGGSSCAGLAFLDWNPSSDPSTTGYRLWRSNTIGSGYTPLFVAPI